MTELGLPYVGVDPRIGTALRTMHFKAHAGISMDPNGHVYIINLHLYAGENGLEDGCLGPVSGPLLASVCRWPHDPDVLLNAMFAAGVLYQGQDGNAWITDWDKIGGMVFAKRAKWREDKARRRAQFKSTPNSG